jgi:hypothetical protein
VCSSAAWHSCSPDTNVQQSMAEELFAIESQAPPGPDGDELRKKLRSEKSKPIVARIKEFRA